MRANSSNNAGIALLFVAFTTVVIAGAAALVVNRVYDSKRQSDAIASQLILDEALKGAIDVAIGEVWGDFNAQHEHARLADYQRFLDATVARNAAVDLAEPNALSIGAATIERLTIARNDTPAGTELRIDATANAGGWTRSVSQTVVIGGAEVELATFTEDEPFPAVFPDLNGNRAIDDAEYATIADNTSGAVTGRLLFPGTTGRFANDDFSPNEIATAQHQIDHHAILLGTNETPIHFDHVPGEEAARITVNGDLMIKGAYSGVAQLIVRGNVYILGDVTSADDSSALAISAGGAILIGDYLTRPTIADGTPIDFRAEHKNRGVITGAVDAGYFADAAPDFSPTGAASFASAAAMTFNRAEHDSARNQPGYIPRYYRMRPGADVWMTRGEDVTFAARYDRAQPLDAPALTGAAIIDLAPANGWVTEQQLRRWWYADELSRPESGRPFRIDALLYTPHAIFGHARAKETHNSNTFGRIEIAGGAFAQHLAIVNALETNANDEHYIRLAGIQDHTRLTLRRITYRKT